MIDAAELAEIDLGDIDSLESIEDLESFFFECDLDGSEGCTSDSSNIVELDQSDIEALGDSEYCFAINGDDEDDLSQVFDAAEDGEAGYCLSAAELAESE